MVQQWYQVVQKSSRIENKGSELVLECQKEAGHMIQSLGKWCQMVEIENIYEWLRNGWPLEDRPSSSCCSCCPGTSTTSGIAMASSCLFDIATRFNLNQSEK